MVFSIYFCFDKDRGWIVKKKNNWNLEDDFLFCCFFVSVSYGVI